MSIGVRVFYGCSSLADMYCYAETLPSVGNGLFDSSNVSNATLHVPASALNKYKTTAPWSSFGRIEPFVFVSCITLSHSSVTLTEDEVLTLTATVTPDDADDKSITWSSSNTSLVTVDANGKVTAKAAGTATITATANDGSGVSASCKVTVVDKQYTVTFMIDDVVVATYSLKRGDPIVAPKAPEREGYTFSGWGKVPETMPAENVTYYGSYTINSYTLTYMVDGEIYATEQVVYGSTPTAMPTPTKEGHTFSGWSEVPETMPANDVTVTGTFTPLKTVYLTILQADNGCLKLKLLEGASCAFVIEAAEGWKINAVTYNGEDVTSQLTEDNTYSTPELTDDATLNISYEQDLPNDVESTRANAIKVRGIGNTIIVNGTTEGETITLYTTDGTMVAHQQSWAGENLFAVDINKVYIVRIGEKVVKIGM